MKVRPNSHMMARIAEVYCTKGVQAAMEEMDKFHPVAAMNISDYLAYLDKRDAVMYAMQAMKKRAEGGATE